MQQYEEYAKDPDYNVFYNAPALVIIYGDSQSHWHAYDCSMIGYNLHLLAEEGGLGCCCIGFAHNIFAGAAVKKNRGAGRIPTRGPSHSRSPGKQKHIGINLKKRQPFEMTFARGSLIPELLHVPGSYPGKTFLEKGRGGSILDIEASFCVLRLRADSIEDFQFGTIGISRSASGGFKTHSKAIK